MHKVPGRAFEIELHAEAFGFGELGVGEHAALTSFAAPFVHMDAVRMQPLGHVGDVAVTVHALPDKPDAFEPVDKLGGARAHRRDKLLVGTAFGLLDVALSMLFGRVVLKVGELLLGGGSGCLDDAAAKRGRASRFRISFVHEHRGTGFGRGARSGKSGSSRAEHDHVGFGVPCFRYGSGEALRSIPGYRRSLRRASGDSHSCQGRSCDDRPFEEVSPGQLFHGSSLQ